MGIVSLVLGLAGCLVTEPGRERVFSAEIGPDGGELTGAGLTLRVPPGALSEIQTLSMRVQHEEVQDHEALSPVYVFEPEGLEFETLVEVEVALDSDELATLYWSDPEDPSRHVFAGLAVDGVARGYTWHFSSAFVSSGTCQPPTAEGEVCGCRADDEIGDLLCVEKPESQTSADCDVYAFHGDDGTSCSGYGLRPVIESWCWCQTEDDPDIQTDGHYLCPDPMELYPLTYCASYNAMSGHEGPEGGACSGYYVDYDADNLPYNVAASGTRLDCDVTVMDHAYESVAGTMECDETVVEGAGPAPQCGGEDDSEPGEFPSWTPACLEELAGADLSCADGEGAQAIADAVMQLFLDVNQLENPEFPRHLTRLVIPDIDGSEACERLLPFDPLLGEVDLVRVLPPFDGPEVVVEIAELSPLDASTLPLGIASLYSCYEERIEEAGRACETTEPSELDDEERAFCQALQAQGRRVVLGEQVSFLWEPAPSRLFPDLPLLEVPGLGPIRLSGCTSGLTTFLCE